MKVKMNIRSLFRLSALLLVLTVSIFISSNFIQISQIKSNNKVLSDYDHASISAMDVKFHVVQIQQFLTDASLTGDLEGIKEAETHLSELKKSVKFLKGITPSEEKLLETVESESQALLEVGKEMVDAYLKQGKEAGDQIMKRKDTGLDDKSDLLSRDVDLMVSEINKLKVNSQNNLDHAILNLKNSILILTVILFSMMAGIFSLLRSRINDVAILIQDLIQAGQQVSLAGQEIASSSQSLSQSATKAAASIENTSASTEEIHSMIQSNAENAGHAKELSVIAQDKAQKGKNEVINLIASVDTISMSSRKIEEIITVIDDIAFQTNLLALNAAVEAARAGEQGKGFAVVADAVRGLAQRSANSAKEINDLIKSSVDQIEQVSDVASHSGKALEEIVSFVEKVTQLNTEISSGSHEQSRGIELINRSINDLDQVTQSNAAAAEQCASASEELAAQSQQLLEHTKQLSNIVGVKVKAQVA